MARTAYLESLKVALAGAVGPQLNVPPCHLDRSFQLGSTLFLVGSRSEGRMMPRFVNGSSLVIGDVIQDQVNTGDTHPFLVVGRSQFQITLRNCTSHETSALSLVKILKQDKTGDPGWSGKDSYVVKSGNTTNLSAYSLVTVETGEFDCREVVVGPQQPMQFMGPTGPYVAWVYPTQVVSVPRLVNRYSDIIYRVVGGISAERMKAVLDELSA